MLPVGRRSKRCYFPCLQIVIDILIGQRHGRSILHLLRDLCELLLINLGDGWGKSGSSNEFLLFHVSKDKIQEEEENTHVIPQGVTYQTGVTDELASEPQEWLLEVVVRLGGDIVVLEVLLAVEGDGLGLDLTLLHVDLVTAENDGDVLADTDEITCASRLS